MKTQKKSCIEIIEGLREPTDYFTKNHKYENNTTLSKHMKS